MEAITQLSARLIESRSDTGDADSICAALYAIFSSVASARSDSDWNASRQLEDGLALSPALAATCLLDGRRTQAFVRGVIGAISEVSQRSAAGPIEVVYAGTGPFAPLVLLAIPHVDLSRVRFTLLDIHEESVRSVRALLRAFDARECVIDVMCSDATGYRHPRPVDVLISETMKRSLAEEPFVAIRRNFLPQLAPGAALIPERVTIELALLDAVSEQARWSGDATVGAGQQQQGKVFEIDGTHVWPAPPDRTTTVRVSADFATGPKWVALQTHIVVYKDERLNPYESGLTTPEVLWDLSPVSSDITLEFSYTTGVRPGLHWQRREESLVSR